METCTGDEVAFDNDSQECAICLERVMAKPDARFGLLECEHSFCLECIRNWRASTTSSADSTSVHRSCPLCRVMSYVVVPSLRYLPNGPAKDAVMSDYKAKLGCVAFKKNFLLMKPFSI